MCSECEPEEETAKDKYFDGSGEASFHPTDEPGSVGVAKSVEDAKFVIEYLINDDYQTISGRRPLVFPRSPSASTCTSASSRRPW